MATSKDIEKRAKVLFNQRLRRIYGQGIVTLRTHQRDTMWKLYLAGFKAGHNCCLDSVARAELVMAELRTKHLKEVKDGQRPF